MSLKAYQRRKIKILLGSCKKGLLQVGALIEKGRQQERASIAGLCRSSMYYEVAAQYLEAMVYHGRKGSLFEDRDKPGMIQAIRQRQEVAREGSSSDGGV